MDRLDAMSILLEAVDSGSLSAAGRKLGVPLATVSRKVSELESHLKTRLVQRGARKLMLTDAGHSYVEACRRIMEDIAEAERAAAGEYRTPQGELVISAPLVLGRTHLVPILGDFLRTYPEIQIRLQLSDRFVNLVEEHIDIAVRIGALPDSSLVATRVGLLRLMLCASPSYLAARGRPGHPDELAGHDCVSFDAMTAGGRWVFRKDGAEYPVPIRARLALNTAEAAVSAMVAGIGIGRAASYHVEEPIERGELEVLIPEYEPVETPVSFVYPGQRLLPLKLRAFLDFATPRLRAKLHYGQG